MASEIDTSSRQARAARAVEDAERDANKRIQATTDRVKETQKQADRQLQTIRDEYVKSATAEYGRQDLAVEGQKNKGYEQVRELQRAQANEARKIRTEGDSHERLLQDHYRSTLYNLNRAGDGQLQEAQVRLGREIEYAKMQGELTYDAAHEDNATRLNQLRDHQDATYGTVLGEAQKQYEKMKENTEGENERARVRFQDSFTKTVDGQQQTLERINAHASRKIEDIRSDTAAKLDGYQTRQRDPFYKLQEIDADISESRDAFVITARVPKHEQKNVTVSIKGGNQLVVSGYRRSEEKLEREPGHVQSTSSYQTFSESVPLTWPVDGRALTREFKGDEIIVTIPKKPFYTANAPHKAPKITRARVERPQFADNIPTPEKAPVDMPRDPEPSPSKKFPGSETLT